MITPNNMPLPTTYGSYPNKDEKSMAASTARSAYTNNRSQISGASASSAKSSSMINRNHVSNRINSGPHVSLKDQNDQKNKNIHELAIRIINNQLPSTKQSPKILENIELLKEAEQNSKNQIDKLQALDNKYKDLLSKYDNTILDLDELVKEIRNGNLSSDDIASTLEKFIEDHAS